MIQPITFQATQAFAKPQIVAIDRPETSLVDTFASTGHGRSVGESAKSGAAVGAGFGTIFGSIGGGATTLSLATYEGAKLGSHFGLIGTIVGGTIGLAGSALEERYLGIGTKIGALTGFAVGGAIGGVIGGVAGLLR